MPFKYINGFYIFIALILAKFILKPLVIIIRPKNLIF